MKEYRKLSDIQKDLSEKKLTCQELIRHYLDNIHQYKDLNVFLSVFDEEAISKAKEIDQKISEGKAGALAGLVVGIKDVLCYKDHPLQSASKMLDGFVSQFTSTVVQRLLDQDAIIIGRQNCDEFAMGSSNENSSFGPTLNGIDKNKVPGGSSGASAVAIQSDMCLISLGSDTGGSVRQPAAFCGVLGLKPTYSRLSRYGLIAYASSFDCIGILGHCTEDIALVLEHASGKDDYDSTVSHREVPQYSKLLENPTQNNKKVAYLKEGFDDAVQPEIRQAFQEKITLLKEQGYEVEEVELPLKDFILPTYYILTTAEASSNLSRYDGVRYGFRSKEAKDLASLYKKTRTEGFGPEVKRRIMLGTFVLSASYYDAFYTKAQKIRRMIKEKTDELFTKYDFILSPTTPTTAFEIGSFSDDPIQMYLSDLFTIQANLVGIPAISFPAGKDKDGMPIGIQVMAPAFEEAKLLNIVKILK